MTLSSQVCSLPLAKRLKELGVKQESLFWWGLHGKSIYYEKEKIQLQVKWQEKGNEDWASAFTASELGEMLPERVYDQSGAYLFESGFYTVGKKPYVKYAGVDKDIAEVHADTEADARALMLIHLKENGIVV